MDKLGLIQEQNPNCPKNTQATQKSTFNCLDFIRFDQGEIRASSEFIETIQNSLSQKEKQSQIFPQTKLGPTQITK